MKENGCDDMTYTQIVAAASSSGFLVALLCTPFDVIKNVMQSNSVFQNKTVHVSSASVISFIYKNHGIKGFWTGIRPALCVIITGNIIFFSLYEEFKKYENSSIAIAGVKARFVSAIFIAPFEFIRTKTQVYLGNKSAWNLTRQIINDEGILCMWRGIIPTLVRDIPFSASYWKINDYFFSLVQRYDKDYENRPPLISKFVYPFISGGTSAGIACILSHPFDVIKTHIQSTDTLSHTASGYIKVRNVSAVRITKNIYSKKGMRGFTVGLLPRLTKIIPSCAVLLGTYELSKFIINT